MEEGTSLSDILSGDEPTSEPEAQQGRPRDEHGRFAPVNPPQDEEQGDIAAQPQQEGPPPSEPEPDHIPIAALKDERSKRQRIEQEHRQALERLQQYEAYFQQANQQPEPGVDPEQDPLEWITQQVAQQVLSQVQPQTQQQQLMMRGYVSEQFARQKWPDYDDKAEVFKQEAERNPFLYRELMNADDPASYIYTAANNIVAARTYGTTAPPSEAEIEARLREKIMAEIGINRPSVPTSLASAQSRGSRSGPAWSGPAPLSDLLGR
jgi:hypothetical protein